MNSFTLPKLSEPVIWLLTLAGTAAVAFGASDLLKFVVTVGLAAASIATYRYYTSRQNPKAALYGYYVATAINILWGLGVLDAIRDQAANTGRGLQGWGIFAFILVVILAIGRTFFGWFGTAKSK